MRKGSIDLLPSGRFRVRVSVAGKQTTWGTFDTREVAQRELDLASDAAEVTSRDYEGLTLGVMGERIVARREVHAEVRDPRSDRSRWDRHFKGDEIAKIAIARMQPKHIHSWIVRLREKGLALQTIRNCRNLLSVILSEACEQGTIKTNPCADVRLRKGAKKSEQDGWTYLVPDEQVRLVKSLPAEEACIVAFAIWTGLRAGELCALRRVDVDPEGRRMLIRFGGPPSEPTKTGKVRAVPLFGHALEAIKLWIELTSPPADGPLFPRRARKSKARPSKKFGAFRDPNHVIDWKQWKGAIATAGIERRLRWHDLRHTCASSLVSGWWGRVWKLEEVRDMLGHTSIDVTQRYAHLGPGVLQEAGKLTGTSMTRPLVTGPSSPQIAEKSEDSSDFLNRRLAGSTPAGGASESPVIIGVSDTGPSRKRARRVTRVTLAVSDALERAKEAAYRADEPATLAAMEEAAALLVAP